MIDRILIDTLNIKSRDFAVKWENLIRNNEHLKHYQDKDDETLIEAGRNCFRLLSRILDRGFDHSLIENFFAEFGKKHLHGGFPVSEAIFSLNLMQKVVIEFIMTEFAPENPMRMYQSLGALTRIAEFFLLGSFYITKGFLEEAYTGVSSHDKGSKDFFKKFFKDDCFIDEK